LVSRQLFSDPPTNNESEALGSVDSNIEIQRSIAATIKPGSTLWWLTSLVGLVLGKIYREKRSWSPWGLKDSSFCVRQQEN
jgi:hypothetical protein